MSGRLPAKGATQTECGAVVAAIELTFAMVHRHALELHQRALGNNGLPMFAQTGANQKEVSNMRRVTFAVLLPTLAILIAGTSASAAAADPTCYAETGNAFGVGEDVLINNEKTVQLADGAPIPGGFVAQSSDLGAPFVPTRTTGRFVAIYSNESTNKTITKNISGPNWFTFDPTPVVTGAIATGTEVATGNNGNLFGPLSQENIPEPALTFTSGLLILHFEVLPGNTFVVTSFSLKGNLVDGCALLAG